MRRAVTSIEEEARPLRLRLPWWFRPSAFLLVVTLPALLLFSFSDPSLTLSKAQLFFSPRDMWLGIFGVFLLFCGTLLGESRLLRDLGPRSLRGGRPRVAELFISEKFDWILMGIFLVSHLIFFRGFFMNPGLVAGVLGGNLELKHTFETIPGVTTWTQVSMLLATVRALRWSKVLPGEVKLISVFHLTIFAVLFVRAILWSERLALIEGVLPFFLCAVPRLMQLTGRVGRRIIAMLPLFAPMLLFLVFTSFEFLRSWQSNSSGYGNVFQFGFQRLFTYYFEAMNTGAATLANSEFYNTTTLPMSEAHYEQIFEGLYQGSLDIEFNNTSGIWYLATRVGNLLFIPVFLALGFFYGRVWQEFREGRIFGFLLPLNFMGLMEILRVHYWFGAMRVLPTTLLIVVLLVWAQTVSSRVRIARGGSGPEPDARALNRPLY